jgi:hypothetical protein
MTRMGEATPSELGRRADARERLADRRRARAVLIPRDPAERRWASLSDDDISLLGHLRQSGGGCFDVADLTAAALGDDSPSGMAAACLDRLAAAHFLRFTQTDDSNGWRVTVEVEIITEETPPCR